MDALLCECCDEHEPTHLIDVDLGDGYYGEGPVVVYRLACPECAKGSSYMDAVPLTPKLLDTYLHRPWNLNL